MKRFLACTLLASASYVASGTIAASSVWAADAAVPAVADGISGVVTGSKGPEAGVWVIAETTDLPTRFIKIVVTDDQGRYVLPQLPKAKYNVWVRGYGLVDSKPVQSAPGKHTDLTAVSAPDTKAAAQYYPANYWLALLHPPAPSEFPGTGVNGNGIAPIMKTQQDWLGHLKNRCHACHQVGDLATRELANNTPEGWAQRIALARPAGDPSIGNRGPGYAMTMGNIMAEFGKDRALKVLADWTGRIAAGEIPPQAPPRPTGVERNVVLSLWDWNTGGSYLHDMISSDRRNPSVNANGPIYGTESNRSAIAVLNPVTNATREIFLPGAGKTVDQKSPNIDATYPHNPMLDQKGRLWVTDLGPASYLPPGPPQPLPSYCADGAGDKFAKYYPIAGKLTWQVHIYDPATDKLSAISTCFGVQHLNFAPDKDNTLYFSGDMNAIGWIDTKTWDETHDPQKATGWCPMVIDTKEKGVTKVAFGGGEDGVTITPDHTQWNELGKPLDPKKDTHIAGRFLYGMEVSPADGSIWFANHMPAVPSAIVRFDRGAHPPETCKTEYYEPPKLPDGSYVAFNARGVSIDSKGIVWIPFTSGKLAKFDRSKCKVLTGPTAVGQQCTEGWTFYDVPGPSFATTNVKSDWFYLAWVDWFNVMGLGKDVPIMPGNLSDSLIAFLPDTEKFVTLRVPYPLGFFTREMDGRIDDPKAGWKGRGIWSTYSDIPVWHQEGGNEGTGPELVKFQIRPDPLAY